MTLRKRRGQPAINIGSEVIPGYAMLAIAGRSVTAGKAGYAQDVIEQQTIWHVRQVTAEDIAQNEPWLFCCNGPIPISPDQVGEVFQDWPCQVLHQGTGDILENQAPCRPIQDRWYTLSGGSLFVCLSHDKARAWWNNTTGEHTVWIAPSSGRGIAYAWELEGGNSSIAYQESVDLTESSPSRTDFLVEFSAEAKTATIVLPGVYAIHLSAALTGTGSTDRGDVLSLAVERTRTNADATEEAENIAVISRVWQDITDDNSPPTRSTLERPAIQRIVELQADDVLRVVSESQNPMSATTVVLGAIYLGPARQALTSSEVASSGDLAEDDVTLGRDPFQDLPTDEETPLTPPPPPPPLPP